MSELKVVVIGTGSITGKVQDILDALDATGVETEYKDLVMELHNVERERPPIISPLEGDSKPYPERNHRKGKRKKY